MGTPILFYLFLCLVSILPYPNIHPPTQTPTYSSVILTINIKSIYFFDIRYVGGMGDIVILFDLIFMLVTTVGWYKAVKSMRRSGLKGYVSNVWHLLHFIVTFCSTGAVVLFIVRLLFVKWQV